MLAVRTPGAPQATRTLARPAIPPSPLRDRVGYSDHVRFRGYFPVHFIPAYNLPVYASQWPLPDTTQDSVRGCSLGFTAAAISGDRLQRTCTAQRSSNRTCELPHTAFSHPIRPSLSAGRSAGGECGRGRASHRDTRPGSGGTRRLVSQLGASTSGGVVDLCTS